jgi:dTDP-4-dehydrorhamnose 3,5-epimerase
VSPGASRPADERWQRTAIDGVLRSHLQRHEDVRGAFTELWRSSWLEGIEPGLFVQANLSRSRAGVLRGLHVHRRQADLWIVLEGAPFVALVDLRAAVSGRGEARSETLELSADEALYIPPLVAHGFYARTDIVLNYLVTQEFDGSDETGFAWDDVQVSVRWPTGDPILSERDRSAPSLAEVLDTLRQPPQSVGT